MSKTKRRVRALKSASTRAVIQRRAAGARAAKAASTQAATAADPADASARDGARFIVLERTIRDQMAFEPDCAFMVVEAVTLQVPENFFGRDWRGYHAAREDAQQEAGELNALAERFLTTTEPVIAPIGVPGTVLGGKRTAWEATLLAPTQEMPVITEDVDPLELPGAATLRAAVGDIAQHPGTADVAETRDEPSAASPKARTGGKGHRALLVDDATARTVQLPRILDVQNAILHEGHAAPVIPGLRPALPHEIRPGQQVLCTDGAWRGTEGGSLRNGVAVVVMADLTEHKVNAAVRFWVRETPPEQPATGLQRPTCPNGCFRTAEDFHLCTCNFGCGCAPHPPRAAAKADTRELHLAGAVA